jgi:4-amino-4-deoxy-L-arabinose transferase-like glycosyltransferase
MQQASFRSVLIDRGLWPLWLGATVLHLLLASAFGLSPDEAHYALYASHLDWSYFDHPPLVGWLQWPALALGGQDVALRVLPMLCWCLSALGLVLLTQRLFPQSTSSAGAPAKVALLLWVLSPLPHLLGLALVPDTLLMPLICLVMLLTWRLCQSEPQPGLGPWLALGLALGLAGLSKYTAVLIGLGALLALLLAHGARLLRTPGFWLAALLACVLVLPVLVWNIRHDWISFSYQAQHAAGQRSWLPQRVAVFALVQGLAYGLLLPVGLVAAWRSLGAGLRWRRPGTPMSPLALVACFGLPPLMLLAVLSGRGSTLPHWSISAWLALTPAAAVGCLALWQRHRRWMAALGGLQALALVAMVSLLWSAGLGSETGDQRASLPGQMLESAPRNPVADLYGWDAAATRAGQLAAERGVTTLAVMNWSLASRVAWYARPWPVKVVRRHFDQFDLWFGSLQPGESVLLLDWSLMSFEPPVGPDQFQRCELIEQQPIHHTGRQIAHFNHLLCHHWQGH